MELSFLSFGFICWISHRNLKFYQITGINNNIKIFYRNGLTDEYDTLFRWFIRDKLFKFGEKALHSLCFCNTIKGVCWYRLLYRISSSCGLAFVKPSCVVKICWHALHYNNNFSLFRCQQMLKEHQTQHVFHHELDLLFCTQ